MDKKWHSTSLIALVLFVVLMIAAGLWYWCRRPASVQTSPVATISHNYAASVADDAMSISITDNGTQIGSITVNEIPSFDLNENGVTADPASDYLFGPTDTLDAAHGILYFSVYDNTTAGNVNASRALFSYNIQTTKLVLLTKEDMSASFGLIEPSADGQFLVYDDGSHGGECYDTVGLEVYDLKNATITADIFLPENTTGAIVFDHWIATSSFMYEKDTFPSVAACRASGESDPKVTRETYVLK
jgi:hypothetical protein